MHIRDDSGNVMSGRVDRLATEPPARPQQFPDGPEAGEDRQPTESEVAAIQWALGIAESGYGTRTRDAIWEVQAAHDIPVDCNGNIGPKTWAIISAKAEEHRTADVETRPRDRQPGPVEYGEPGNGYPDGGPYISDAELDHVVREAEKAHDGMAVFACTLGLASWLPQLAKPFDPEQVRLEYIAAKQAEYDRQSWEQLAAQIVNGLEPGIRNVERSLAYLEMNRIDPDTYQWAGMAFYASTMIGTLMQACDQVGATDMHTLLEAGNDAVFKDIYWQHMAYEQRGIAHLSDLYRYSQLDPAAYAAWTLIDEGRQLLKQARLDSPLTEASLLMYAQAKDLIWEGNRRLLRYEQLVVLQPAIYNGDKLMWSITSQFAVSPLGHGERSFAEYHADEDRWLDKLEWDSLADPEERMDWVENELLAAWMQLSDHYRAVVDMDMDAYRARFGLK